LAAEDVQRQVHKERRALEGEKQQFHRQRRAVEAEREELETQRRAVEADKRQLEVDRRAIDDERHFVQQEPVAAPETLASSSDPIDGRDDSASAPALVEPAVEDAESERWRDARLEAMQELRNLMELSQSE